MHKGWLACIFPGQGAQCVGMGVEAAVSFPEAKAVLEEADDVLGEPLSQLMAQGPEEKLMWTVNAQPAILAASYALAVVLLRRLPKAPDWLAGHSLGEYTALVVAQSLTFADALRTVRARGRFMDAAAPVGSGAMSAVLGLDCGKIAAVCESMSRPGHIVEIANYNSPAQIVIAGHAAAVAAATEPMLAAGAKRVVPLPVSGPFHTSLMQEAQQQLTEFLQGVRVSRAVVPVVANATGKPMRGARTIQEHIARQVASPVLWEQSVRYLLEQGVRCFTEIGPRSVLLPLVRRVDKEAVAYPVTDAATLVRAAEALEGPLAQDLAMEQTVLQAKEERKREAVLEAALAAAAKKKDQSEGKPNS